MKTVIRIAVVAAAAGFLAACASPSTEDAKLAATPLDQFPLRAELTPDQTLIAVHPQGLSPAQAAALAALAERWRANGTDVITVRSPRGGPADVAGQATAAWVRSALVAEGVSPQAIRVADYASADPGAPVVVAFSAYAAHVADCGRSWDNLSGTQSNNVPANFGCAVSANMAAQIADPADIVRPRSIEPSDAGRRVTVIEAYRKGDTTSSKTDAGGSGAISNAVK